MYARNQLVKLSCAIAFGLLTTAAQAESPTLAKIKRTGTVTLGYRESSIPFSYLGADQKPVGSRSTCVRKSSTRSKDIKLDKLAVTCNR